MTLREKGRRHGCLGAIGTLVALTALQPAAQEVTDSIKVLLPKYARFLSAEESRRYLTGLEFDIGGTEEQSVTLRIKGQPYRIDLLSIHNADDCEACGGVVDAFIFRGSAPFTLERGLFEGGHHGRAYVGDASTVMPLARDLEGLAITGEMWAPRGCSVWTIDLFGLDTEGKTLKRVYDRVFESCEEGTLVSDVQFTATRLDAAGRGMFSLSWVEHEGKRQRKFAEAFRFDPATWALVEVTR